jgi:hypothetical protein
LRASSNVLHRFLRVLALNRIAEFLLSERSCYLRRGCVASIMNRAEGAERHKHQASYRARAFKEVKINIQPGESMLLRTLGAAVLVVNSVRVSKLWLQTVARPRALMLRPA